MLRLVPVSGAQPGYSTLHCHFSRDTKNSAAYACMSTECITSRIWDISAMVMLKCRVCGFLSWTVQRTSYLPLHVLCTAVKQEWRNCKVTRIVLEPMTCFSVLTNHIPSCWLRFCNMTESLWELYTWLAFSLSLVRNVREVNWTLNDTNAYHFCDLKAPLCILCACS